MVQKKSEKRLGMALARRTKIWMVGKPNSTALPLIQEDPQIQQDRKTNKQKVNIPKHTFKGFALEINSYHGGKQK